MRSGLSPLGDWRILTKSGALMRSAAGIGDGSVGLPCKAPGIGSAGAAKTSRAFMPMVRSEPRKKGAASATATLEKVRDFNMISSFPIILASSVFAEGRRKHAIFMRLFARRNQPHFDFRLSSNIRLFEAAFNASGFQSRYFQPLQERQGGSFHAVARPVRPETVTGGSVRASTRSSLGPLGRDGPGPFRCRCGPLGRCRGGPEAPDPGPPAVFTTI